MVHKHTIFIFERCNCSIKQLCVYVCVSICPCLRIGQDVCDMYQTTIYRQHRQIGKTSNGTMYFQSGVELPPHSLKLRLLSLTKEKKLIEEN